MVKPVPVAIKNKDGRWSVARTPRSSNASSKENRLDENNFTDFKPVLPCVVHEAAATLVNLGFSMKFQKVIKIFSLFRLRKDLLVLRIQYQEPEEK